MIKPDGDHAAGAVEPGLSSGTDPLSSASETSIVDAPEAVSAPEQAPGDTTSVGPEAKGQVKGRPAAKRRGKKAKKPTKPSLGSSRGVETMFRTSYRTHLDLSSLADTKANIMISINGIIISITIASISPKIDANPWLLVPTSVLLLACMGSMVYAILAARPRISSKVVSLEDVRSNRANILFFGNFVNMPEEEFLSGMKELMGDTDRLYSNMMRDIYSLGGVLSRKYALVRVAYNIFMVGLSFSVVLFVVVLTWAAYTQGFNAG